MGSVVVVTSTVTFSVVGANSTSNATDIGSSVELSLVEFIIIGSVVGSTIDVVVLATIVDVGTKKDVVGCGRSVVVVSSDVVENVSVVVCSSSEVVVNDSVVVRTSVVVVGDVVVVVNSSVVVVGDVVVVVNSSVVVVGD